MPTRPYAALPPAEPVSVERAVDEGLLIARATLTLALKNHIIVRAIRDDRSYDPANSRRFLKREAASLADEQADSAKRMRKATSKARWDEAAPRHIHDYGRFDLKTLKSRATVYKKLAKRLRALADDESALGELIEAARVKAWNDVGAEIETRLDRVRGLDIDDYYFMRDQRIEALIDDLHTLGATGR